MANETPRRGRPRRSTDAADVRVMLRLTPDEYAAIEAAAAVSDVTVSAFVRAAAVRAARRHT